MRPVVMCVFAVSIACGEMELDREMVWQSAESPANAHATERTVVGSLEAREISRDAETITYRLLATDVVPQSPVVFEACVLSLASPDPACAPFDSAPDWRAIGHARSTSTGTVELVARIPRARGAIFVLFRARDSRADASSHSYAPAAHL